MTRSYSPSSAQDLRDNDLSSQLGRGSAASRLSGKDMAALIKAREGRWQPGLADQPLHSEIFASAQDASGAGFALALAQDALRVAAAGKDDPLAEVEDRRQILWVQESHAVKLGGRPYLHGLPADLQDRIIHVEAQRPEDALFALEEGLKCRDLSCVIGEIAGNPRALDFTASRRLSLAAEKHGIALWLVRIEAQRDLSSARMRWDVRPAPSSPPRWNAQAPGPPVWQAELFRAARFVPGKWTLDNDKGKLARKRSARTSQSTPKPANTQDANIQDRAAHIGDLVRPTVGRSLAAVARG